MKVSTSQLQFSAGWPSHSISATTRPISLASWLARASRAPARPGPARPRSWFLMKINQNLMKSDENQSEFYEISWKSIKIWWNFMNISQNLMKFHGNLSKFNEISWKSVKIWRNLTNINDKLMKNQKISDFDFDPTKMIRKIPGIWWF